MLVLLERFEEEPLMESWEMIVFRGGAIRLLRV
jgi:hypothetical protein